MLVAFLCSLYCIATTNCVSSGMHPSGLHALPLRKRCCSLVLQLCDTTCLVFWWRMQRISQHQ